MLNFNAPEKCFKICHAHIRNEKTKKTTWLGNFDQLKHFSTAFHRAHILKLFGVNNINTEYLKNNFKVENFFQKSMSDFSSKSPKIVPNR